MNIVGELRCYLDDDYATLRYSESRTSLSLDVILVPAAHRGRGIGTALIARVLLLADATGREVHVSARPIGATGGDALARLVAYYQRFGFVEIDRGVSTAHMRRSPQAGAPTAPTLLLTPAILGRSRSTPG